MSDAPGYILPEFCPMCGKGGLNYGGEPGSKLKVGRAAGYSCQGKIVVYEFIKEEGNMSISMRNCNLVKWDSELETMWHAEYRKGENVFSVGPVIIEESKLPEWAKEYRKYRQDWQYPLCFAFTAFPFSGGIRRVEIMFEDETQAEPFVINKG